jgi:quinol monooxygenase YgiN
MITHTVFFKLKHAAGSAAESAFLERALTLAEIPGVIGLRCVRQTGRKNDYAWGLLMDFADQRAYDAYNADPRHTAFVQQYWLPEVEQFLEIDYVPR